MSRIIWGLVAALSLMASFGAYAGGLTGRTNPSVATNGVWEFRSADDRQVQINAEDLRQRHDNGYYDQWQVTNYSTYNIDKMLSCTNGAWGTSSSNANSGGSTDTTAPNNGFVSANQSCTAK